MSCRLKWYHQSQFAGLYAATELGFFEEKDIRCKLLQGGTHINVVKQVVTRNEDFGICGADQIIIARSKGIPVKAIAVILKQSPVCFFSKKGSNINAPNDFVGKKVGMQYGTNVRTEYIAMLNKLNINPDLIIETPSRFDIQMFLEGKVDVWNGYTFNEPLLANESGVNVNVIKPSDYGINFYADCLITSDTLIKEDPELVEKFTKSFIKGWKYSLSNHDKIIPLVLKQNPKLKIHHEMNMLNEITKLCYLKTNDVSFGLMDLSYWEEMAEILEVQGLLGDNKFLVSDLFSNNFLLDNVNEK